MKNQHGPTFFCLKFVYVCALYRTQVGYLRSTWRVLVHYYIRPKKSIWRMYVYCGPSQIKAWLPDGKIGEWRAMCHEPMTMSNFLVSAVAARQVVPPTAMKTTTGGHHKDADQQM